MTFFNLRKARVAELPVIIAIDDAASQLYADAGLAIELKSQHPFIVAESTRWANAISHGLAYVATNELDQAIGFITLGFIDTEHYLDQIAVLPEHMQQGIGTKLLELAIAWSHDKPLWLTTYSHIPWNKPYYEKQGFKQMTEDACGPQLCQILHAQRLALPAPEQRIAMVRLANTA